MLVSTGSVVPLAVAALCGLRDRGQLVTGLDLTVYLEELAAGAKLFHVVTHDRR
jgi:hypothetical protein